jgi:hypothetical protein
MLGTSLLASDEAEARLLDGLEKAEQTQLRALLARIAAKHT